MLVPIRNRVLTGRNTSNWRKTDDLQVTVPLYQLSYSNGPWEVYGAAGLGLRTLLGEDHCIHNHSELATSRADCHWWCWIPTRFFLGSPIRVSEIIIGQGSATLGAVQFWKQNEPANRLPELSPPCVLGPQVGHWDCIKCLCRTGHHSAQDGADLWPKRFHPTPSPPPQSCVWETCVNAWALVMWLWEGLLVRLLAALSLNGCVWVDVGVTS